jgi:hypothetical protein
LYIDGILQSSEVTGSPYESYAAFVAGAGASITPSKYAYVTFTDADTWPTGGKWDQITAGDTWRLDCSDTQWLPTSNMTAATTATLLDQTATDALKQAGNDSVTAWLQNFRDVLKGLLLKFTNGVVRSNLSEDVQRSLDKADLVIVGEPNASNYSRIFVDSVGGDDTKDGFSNANRVQTLTRAFQILSSLKTASEVAIVLYDNTEYTLPANFEFYTSLHVQLIGYNSTQANRATIHVSNTTDYPVCFTLVGNWMFFDVNIKATINRDNTTVLALHRGLSLLNNVIIATESGDAPTFAGSVGASFQRSVVQVRFTAVKNLAVGFSFNYTRATVGSHTTETNVTLLFRGAYSTIDADTVDSGVTYTTLKEMALSTFNYGNNGFIDLSSKVTDISSKLNLGTNIQPILCKKNGIYYFSFYALLVNNANFAYQEIVLKLNMTFKKYPVVAYSNIFRQTTGEKIADAFWFLDLQGNFKARPMLTIPASGQYEISLQVHWPEEFVLTGGV